MSRIATGRLFSIQRSSRKDRKGAKAQRRVKGLRARLCVFAIFASLRELLLDALQHPDVDVYFFSVVQDGLSFWFWQTYCFDHRRVQSSKLSFVQLVRLVKDARAKELAFKLTVENITLGEEKFPQIG